MVKLVAGLGNPGEKYSATRHNMGFMVADALAARLRAMEAGKRWRGVVARAELAGETVWLLKPQTYMNNSGISVRLAVRELNLPLASVLVVCDDLALPLGMLRFRSKGSSGGQKGLESVIRELGTEEFNRLRLGIGADVALTPREFVLAPFDGSERHVAGKVIQRAVAGCVIWLTRGIEAAMNQSNGFIPELNGDG